MTGEGSLNAHFKNLYNRIREFSQEQLEKVMTNSMLPILKIDDRNRYDYYPQLDASIFNNQVYEGDLGDYADLQKLLMIKEKIIEKNVENYKEESIKPDNYTVIIEERNDIKVKLLNKYIRINNMVFEKALFIDVNNIDQYKGRIHTHADGEGWVLLNNSRLNSLLQSVNYYYEGGEHYIVQNTGVKKTAVAKVYGLYVCKEENIPYQGNSNICNVVVEFMLDRNIIWNYKSQAIINILKYVSSEKAQIAINTYLSIKRDDSSMIEYGLNLLENGLLYGWNSSTLKMFANKANERQLNLIYKANSRLAYDVAQLIKIEYDLLSKSHKAEVDKFNADLQAKRDTIKKIIGDITTKGLRENAKRLKSDSDTRKFSDLCNKLIGHVKADLDKASLTEVERWLKDALELKECALKIQSKLNK